MQISLIVDFQLYYSATKCPEISEDDDDLYGDFDMVGIGVDASQGVFDQMGARFRKGTQGQNLSLELDCLLKL